MKTARETSATGHHQAWAPILEVSLREVFEMMLSSELKDADRAQDGPMDMTSMVGLAGQLCGVLSIQCSQEAAKLMASKMLGIEPQQVGPELCDAFGEICNMVAGNFKNKISGLGNGCILSVPTVISGNDYSLHSSADSDTLEVRMAFEGNSIVTSLRVQA
jgi:chemotaxis protein CheX